ncbi:MAG: MCE family protein [Candidatus Omnitrophica bacterium]|nr:MCE family protein [Candidatus Omnitrophota bacterium]
MLFGKTKLELKVGAFVFVGLVILVTFVLLIGNFKNWTSGYRVNFIFNFVNGVKVGAPVRFAGVDIGEVQALKFFFFPAEKKTRVKIVGWVNKEVRIPSDSTVWVNTLGLLGEKYIEIMPGNNYTQPLAPGGALTGSDPIAMHEVAQLAKDITANIDESIVKIKNQEGTLGKLLYNDTIYNELEALISDVRRNPWKLFWKTKEKK